MCMSFKSLKFPNFKTTVSVSFLIFIACTVLRSFVKAWDDRPSPEYD